MKVGQVLAGLWLGGLLWGCVPQNSQTETPEGPSEAYETPGAGAQTYDPTAMTDEEAEQAAKVAAAKKVMLKVKDRDPEEEKKKMAKSRSISAQARAKLGKRAHDDAVKTAREALKVHEQNVDAMLVIAEVYYKEGKYELTRAVASSALQVDAKIRTPADTSRAYNLQGFAMLAMGEDTAATQSFKKAAEADEKNAAAWNNLGTRYLDAGDITTATACFKYAIELDPRFFKAQLNYGASLRAERKWEEAEKAIRKSLELRPNYAEAYFNLGVLYLDADPFPGLDTTQRLNKAIQNLGKYQSLAKGAKAGPSTPGLGAAGSAKAPPPRVSKERADDYIRVAKKGLEREARRIEREKGREAKPGAQPATGAEPAVAGDAGVEAGAGSPEPQGGGEPAEPSKPSPQGPGGDEPAEPSKPSPQGPSKPTPSKPSPQGPAKPAPSKPAPQGPAKPAPSKPAPQGPAKPAPSKPAPSKPAPQGPSTPAPKQPSPQKPTVQKPQSASWDGRMPTVKKVPHKPASRGTRWSPSTLISMEAGASVSSCVDLPFTSPFDVVSSFAYGIDVAHGHRSPASSDEPLARRTTPLHPSLG